MVPTVFRVDPVRAGADLLRRMDKQREDENYLTKLGLVNTSLDYNLYN